jgi:hypothetical protein
MLMSGMQWAGIILWITTGIWWRLPRAGRL